MWWGKTVVELVSELVYGLMVYVLIQVVELLSVVSTITECQNC